MDELLLRELAPAVIGVLVRRGADFATAEDAVQEALLSATLTWPTGRPADPKGWLVTVAWRKFLDAVRADTSRRRREERVEAEPTAEPAHGTDDTLQLYFLCAHPSLTPASAVALTLRAVGGLTTRQIAEAYLVPEATMAQRISRAKRTVSGVRLDEPGDLATVLRVLYLVFNEGYSGEVDLADEAIRLARQVRSMTDDEEASAEFRRFTEGTLRDGKAAAAVAIIDGLEEAGLPPELTEDGLVIDIEMDQATAETWMRSFTDLRLALATRLGVEEGDEAYWHSLPEDDPRGQAHDIYDWIGYLQETLVEALSQ